MCYPISLTVEVFFLMKSFLHATTTDEFFFFVLVKTSRYPEFGMNAPQSSLQTHKAIDYRWKNAFGPIDFRYLGNRTIIILKLNEIGTKIDPQKNKIQKAREILPLISFE